jgi:hypothetical protein
MPSEERICFTQTTLNRGLRAHQKPRNQGLSFCNAPNGIQSRPMVGYDVNNRRIKQRCLIHHLPDSYAGTMKNSGARKN